MSLNQTVAHADLKAFIARCLGACGMPESDAATVAGLMAQADLMGQDGHGVFRLPMYIKRIHAGGMNMTPNFTRLHERPATALIDGDNGMGHLVMHHATELAMQKARGTGVAWVGARHSNHAGPASLYAMMPARENMIGLYLAVGSANHMPPWGGTDMLLSTNPIAVALPSRDFPPIVLDMATTVAAYGKVKTAAQRGEMMPEGWMIDRDGKPLTDPNRAADGFLLPIGGPKGYGLSLIFGILAGVLNGAAFGRDVVDFNADATSTTNTGHVILALDIAAFADPVKFRADIDDVWRQMKSSARMTGVDEIRLPGERLNKVTRDRTAQGIPIPAPLRETLADLARDLGVAAL
ncbi:putative oxidoreductase YjmC [Thalassovita gelatinovora]|uniref:Putative oxidoreductase YjmC n=1 Tax=Thalassovita gelatinovora TaxID=53501 RepID=A0A0P1FJC8_THAGE|nr:Ldh family oxidoreductase [Thalassovita gelatinovora]QIZ81620.1 Ldh family oxidoreductase [Thalassovita gelatinovora]CUH68081.1 putative oxidoreductase YjmC [Thalassovita gelatinovora]SEQ28860.1 Malate/lactate/ureidoglycolate dehydrogenase, LDH2 family [Thalassovita gelatinovora]